MLLTLTFSIPAGHEATLLTHSFPIPVGHETMLLTLTFYIPAGHRLGYKDLNGPGTKQNPVDTANLVKLDFANYVALF
ncbi:hypothetical protein DPMN_057602 [Dreissena polymorpha]|uniref:Uncharacterized protein n=1 Tax=Dreissena polymorpha TaxID=45954 RepID=A0A9D4C0E4_DREPO|nr:hypothetical protein DPMN_057602 [Dreissena polymorpha]